MEATAAPVSPVGVLPWLPEPGHTTCIGFTGPHPLLSDQWRSEPFSKSAPRLAFLFSRTKHYLTLVSWVFLRGFWTIQKGRASRIPSAPSRAPQVQDGPWLSPGLQAASALPPVWASRYREGAEPFMPRKCLLVPGLVSRLCSKGAAWRAGGVKAGTTCGRRAFPGSPSPSRPKQRRRENPGKVGKLSLHLPTPQLTHAASGESSCHLPSPPGCHWH